MRSVIEFFFAIKHKRDPCQESFENIKISSDEDLGVGGSHLKLLLSLKRFARQETNVGSIPNLRNTSNSCDFHHTLTLS